MTREQRNRIENRTSVTTLTVRSFQKNDTELVRVVTVDKKKNVNIEFWVRKVTQLADKAFKRQTVHSVTV